MTYFRRSITLFAVVLYRLVKLIGPKSKTTYFVKFETLKVQEMWLRVKNTKILKFSQLKKKKKKNDVFGENLAPRTPEFSFNSGTFMSGNMLCIFKGHKIMAET